MCTGTTKKNNFLITDAALSFFFFTASDRGQRRKHASVSTNVVNGDTNLLLLVNKKDVRFICEKYAHIPIQDNEQIECSFILVLLASFLGGDIVMLNDRQYLTVTLISGRKVGKKQIRDDFKLR